MTRRRGRGDAVRWLLLALVGSTLGFTPALLSAVDFNVEIRVSSGDSLAADPHMIFDIADNVLLTYVDDGNVYFRAGPLFFEDAIQLTDDAEQDRSPVVHASATATITVAFEREPLSAVEGNEIYYVTSALGIVSEPVNLSDDDDPDRDPSFATAGGTRHLAWVREGSEDGFHVYFSEDLGTPEELAEGHHPTIHIGPDGAVVAVYVRDGDLYAVIDDDDAADGFGDEVEVTASTATDSAPAVRVGEDDVAHVVFVRDGDIYYVQGDPAEFGEPVNLSDSDDDSSAPQVALDSDGQPVVLYEETGDVWLVEFSDGEPGEPESVTDSEGDEQQVRLLLDDRGHIHMTYVRDGDVYYTNNAPPPEIDIVISVEEGEIPLEVEFENLGGGVITAQLWKFGDGEISAQRAPTHTYEETGVYDVTLTVYGPGGSQTETYEDLIEAIPIQSIIWVPDIVVFQGEPGIMLPIYGTHVAPAQGFQLAAGYDADVVELNDITTDFTDVSSIAPEFFVVTIEEDGEDSYFTLGAIFDIVQPFDGRTLEPGEKQRLVHLDLDIEFLSPTGDTVIDLRNDLGDPLIENIFMTIDDEGVARTVIPEIIDGTIEVLPFVLPLPKLFTRGDANDDGAISLVDGLKILIWLFVDGPEPDCMDAADGNDDGQVKLGDAILILTFIFSDGARPPYPNPSMGLDPSDDDLGC